MPHPTPPMYLYPWRMCHPAIQQAVRDWLGGMQPARDGEDGPDALAWFEAQVVQESTQAFIGLDALNRPCWLGCIVADDRGVREQLAQQGVEVDLMLGLFNTRFDLRGQGIGWFGARQVNTFLQLAVNDAQVPCTVALFSDNPAAIRHYEALGFQDKGEIFIPSLNRKERLFIATLTPQDD